MDSITASDAMDTAVTFLTGSFAYSAEVQNVGMAIQGAMGVRKGPNKDGRLHWFHAFMLSVIAGFAGGIFNFIWMGKPSGLVSNDLTMGSCIIAFLLVNVVPFAFMALNTLPFAIAIVSSSQLFRALGMMRFVKACFTAFKDSPSAYYPIPVFGPIVYGTLLGNMGPFFMKGFEAHIGNGVPWPIQNGLFCASFYHFYVHDHEGPIGESLRKSLPFASALGLDDETFARALVSLFMQIMGILQMPEFLGPSFTPFGTSLLSPFMDHSTWNVGKEETAYSKKQRELGLSPTENFHATEATASAGQSEGAKKKRKNKKKKTTGVAATQSKQKEL